LKSKAKAVKRKSGGKYEFRDGHLIDFKGRKVEEEEKIQKYRNHLDADVFDCLCLMLVDGQLLQVGALIYFEFSYLAANNLLDVLESQWYELYNPANYFYLLRKLNPVERLEVAGSHLTQLFLPDL